MIKRKLQLKTVLALKEDLEELINKTEDSIARYNVTEKKIDALLEKLARYQEQLVIVKEVIQKANMAKNSDRKTNNYYIYKLSNLQKLKRFYGRLMSEMGSNDQGAQLDLNTLVERRRSIETEISTLQNKLSNFNETKTVSIEIDETLNLDI